MGEAVAVRSVPGTTLFSPGAERPHMPATVRDVLTSAFFVLAAMTALWPPRAVYWERVSAVVGDGPTLVLVGVVAVGLGGVFARLTGVSSRSFATGTVLAYATGMVAITPVLSPDSPAHLVWYAVLAVAILAGATVWHVHAGRVDLLGRSASE